MHAPPPRLRRCVSRYVSLVQSRSFPSGRRKRIQLLAYDLYVRVNALDLPPVRIVTLARSFPHMHGLVLIEQLLIYHCCNTPGYHIHDVLDDLGGEVAVAP